MTAQQPGTVPSRADLSARIDATRAAMSDAGIE